MRGCGVESTASVIIENWRGESKRLKHIQQSRNLSPGHLSHLSAGYIATD